MNKFHVETLRGLTVRFGESEAAGGGASGGQVGEGGKEGEEDELLEYFRSLYRNANKGIKGRGKGRKVASTTTSPPSLSSSTSSLSSLASLPLSPPSSSTGSYTGGIPAHFAMGGGMGMGGGGLGGMGDGLGGMGMGVEMELFDGSSSGIGSPCASSLGSLYEVGGRGGGGFEEEEGGELAFGDRMY
jgi:hypothetical protein